MNRRCPAWIFVALLLLTACAQPTTTAELPLTTTPTRITKAPTTAPASSTLTSPPLNITPIQEATMPPPTPSNASADWPMFRYNLERAGYNPMETKLRPPLELKWEFQAKGKI